MTAVASNFSLYFDSLDWTWTLVQYEKMVDVGILTEEDKVELIFGKIIAKSPVGRFHAACVSALEEFFIPRLLGNYTCRSENPIALLDATQPEPDFVIATHKKDRYVSGHPVAKDIHLVIEVADKTLTKDRLLKAEAYAVAGIKEYWIINLIDRQLEQHLAPDLEKRGYQTISIFQETESFDHAFTGKITVSDLLP